MICKKNDTLSVEFTGQNWLEIGKFLELPEMRAFDSDSNIPILVKAIQHSAEGYRLHTGSWLVRHYPSKAAIPYRSRADAYVGGVATAVSRADKPCIVETNDHIIRAFQYNTVDDINNVVRFLESWRIRTAEYDAGWPNYILYNPAKCNQVALVKHTDWILIYLDNPDNVTIRTMTDTEFQVKYDQIGYAITPREDIRTTILKSVNNSLNIKIPTFTQYCAALKVQGGFAPGHIYNLTMDALIAIGAQAHIVMSKVKAVAFQYVSKDAFVAMTALYPMMTFIEDTSTMYRDKPVIAIMVGDIPSGQVKYGEWLIFEPSHPNNPKFRVVSDEEIHRDYQISE